MKNFPEIKTAKILSENEMSVIRGGSCESCTNGCKDSCKLACQPGNKNNNQGNGNTLALPQQKQTQAQ
jgi:hypothetical protein